MPNFDLKVENKVQRRKNFESLNDWLKANLANCHWEEVKLPLMRGLIDPSERCREAAANCLVRKSNLSFNNELITGLGDCLSEWKR